MSHYNSRKYGGGNGSYTYDRPYQTYDYRGQQRIQPYKHRMGGFRMEGGRGSSPYKYRNYQDGVDYEKDETFTNDPRVFFSQKPADDSEKDSNSVMQYYQNKYRKLLDREQLKKNIEEGIYKVNPQLDNYILNRLIKIRLIFDDKQSDTGELTQKNEDLFQFEETDLKKFFHVFGKIEKIVIKDKCVSYIFFQDLISAFCAQRAMNNFTLDDINARLEIQLCVEDPEEENENKLIGHFMHETIKNDDYMIRINTAEDEKQMKQLMSKYKYTNIFTMEINDPEYHLKERIMGASVSNFYRLYYLCEKNSVETGHGKQNSEAGGEDLVMSLTQAKEIRSQQQQNQNSNSNKINSGSNGTNQKDGNSSNIGSSTSLSTNQPSNSNNSNINKQNKSNSNINASEISNNSNNNNNMNSNNSNNTNNNSGNNVSNSSNTSVYYTFEDITFRMIVNEIKQTENEVLILSNNLEKYNTAVRYMHELLAQVNEEYRRFCEFHKKINPGPLHIKRIEKFNLEPELIFISTKDQMNKNVSGKENIQQKGEGSEKGGGGVGSTSLQFLNNTSNYSMQIESSSSSSSAAGSGGLQDVQQKLQF